MRTYSSGMYGRLAFSVAVNMDPDILLVDEALSVGDARFKTKSFERMQELCARPARSCSSATRWQHPEALHRRAGSTTASCKMWDEPTTVIEAYTEFLDVGDEDHEPDPVTMEDV